MINDNEVRRILEKYYVRCNTSNNESYMDIKDGGIDNIWDKAIFVFDTNALVYCCRFNTDILKKLICHFKNRIFIPFQVYKEFNIDLNVNAIVNTEYSNVSYELRRIIEEINNKITTFDDYKKTFRENHNLDIHPQYNDSNKTLENIITSLNTVKENVQELNKSLRENRDSRTISVPIKDIIKDYMVEVDYSSHLSISDLYNEAEIRYKLHVPPGFNDKGKGLNKYGDLIIWKEIIEISRSQLDRPIIFITNDSKNDWVLKFQKNNQPYYVPTSDLIYEFVSNTKNFFWIYNFKDFVEFSLKRLNIQIKDKDQIIANLNKIDNFDIKYYATVNENIRFICQDCGEDKEININQISSDKIKFHKLIKRGDVLKYYATFNCPPCDFCECCNTLRNEVWINQTKMTYFIKDEIKDQFFHLRDFVLVDKI